ncbi:efflux RND transporter periplasmic adaptor subunit [Paludisphaera rhizosphaerae]|uniref:efflux RND transporter periplasmic adaptor subunit n=1 Tax=Paludisphaera rhizosphaerae TaxID=2711216 RepID=UPI0013ED3919|nr:efflux RND transporter periplasmic adaptor subunit [Paludisphaera rhizosphaerae]
MRHPIGLVLILLSGLGPLGCSKPPAAVVASAPAEVLVSFPVEREVAEYADFTGRLEAVRSVEVRARVGGHLDRVHFQDGDEVKEGDLLFEIDPRPYEFALERAEGTAAQAEARLERLEVDQRRTSNLLSRGASNREEYDHVFADLKEAKASLNVARADRDLAKLNVGFARVAAPFAGRLSRRLVDPGNLVEANTTPLTTIVSLDRMYVYFDIDERTVLTIRSLIRDGRAQSRTGGSTLPILAGLANEEGFPHRGSIDFSDNRLNPRTGTLRVRGTIANPVIEGRGIRMLSPGLFARVRLPFGTPHRALLVTERAVDTDQGQKILYVVDAKDQVAVRPVRLGAVHDGLREVESGLTPGERVVVVGLQQIRPGAVVAPKVVEMPALSVEKDSLPAAAAGGIASVD